MTGRTVTTIHLLRHAKAEPASDGHTLHQDHRRPLAKRGQRAAQALAAHLQSTGFAVDRVYCSTAERARQTLAPLRNVLAGVPTTFRDSLYMIDTDGLLAFLQSLPESVGAVLVVGHNPTFHETALALAKKAAPGQADSLRELSEKFPTGALCSIDCAVRTWSALAPKTGTLTGFLRPRDLTD